MSANKFKIGDKVKVRKELVADEYYGDVICDIIMVRIGGRVLTINSVKRNFYIVEENSFYWTDEMLEPFEKTLDNLCAGDFIKSGSSVRKVLAAVDGCYLLSYSKEYTSASIWYTADELKEDGYSFIDYTMKQV
jgi:hypothetical protein|nr:MAG TPA: NifZ domain [Caudoviricetes sp.]